MKKLTICVNILLLLFFLPSFFTHAKEILVTGRIADISDSPLEDATVSLLINSKEFKAITKFDGTYNIKIPDLYPSLSGLIKAETPFPNPFTDHTSIPLNIGKDGDILFSVYDLSGGMVFSRFFPSLEAGSYRIIWNGTNQNGSPLVAGIYFYRISFEGINISGKLIKVGSTDMPGISSGIESYFPLFNPEDDSEIIGYPVVVSIKKVGYHSLRLTDISLRGDTIMDFNLSPFVEIPFKTSGQYISHYKDNDYKPLILKGINLGSSPPGTFPGEIAYAISPSMYERWIDLMVRSGFNSLRVYTLHPPIFYEKLAEYNYRNPENPLFLFQGIWLDEIDDPWDPSDYDLIARSSSFKESIREVIDCMHGNKYIDFRLGRAHGAYQTDISQWIAGYIIGREVMPQEVDSTNKYYSGLNSGEGNFFRISQADPSEVFVAAMLDELASYEWENYSCRRTLSFSSWPTLDPLSHPTEIYTDEDVNSIDITRITEIGGNSMLFASYHAYPYYPDFINEEPAYRAYSDEFGPNSYLGYLNDLRAHYEHIPLVIGEFGVPSSWGSAHESYSGMPHGGLSEIEQGNINVRLFRNILSAGCAGGFMFAWMDEWFKPTWNVQYMEAFYFIKDGINIPTRQLWHNLMAAEQNFGLIGFEQLELPSWKEYTKDKANSSVSSIKARHSNSYFFLDIQLSSLPESGDTLRIAFDTYLKDIGESVLPDGQIIENRAEFMLEAVKGADTALFYVTEVYDMFGLTPRFNLSDTIKQKFKSLVSDNASWNLMRWINNQFDSAVFETGKLPAGEGINDFNSGKRIAVVWNGTSLNIRIPWTMLYFRDPTQMMVVDGAITYDEGYNYEILSSVSDGIAVSVSFKEEVTNSISRYTWPAYLVIPKVAEREKKSLQIIRSELINIPYYLE